MRKRNICIFNTPAIIWGNSSNYLYLYIHGQGGNKEEAAFFAEIVCHQGWQVLSIDLPEHGERKGEINCFDPWHIVPELQLVMTFIKEYWKQVSLFANSIGAWFSMQSLSTVHFQNCLFVSPVVDMEQLISKMMVWANVTEAQLEIKKKISTSFGQTLSWDYWKYAVEHPINNWSVPTKILYGKKDELIEYDTIQQFVHKFDCILTVMEKGKHWFHTKEELSFLSKWVGNSLEK